jgi:dihydropteroate synthase
LIPDDFPDWLGDPRRRPLVMGILNLTPDSFSDGGHFTDPGAAISQARQMVEDGADWIDIGGESTRPGASRIAADEQIARVVPVLRAVRSHIPALISIDTTLAAVAQAALDCGADVVNDISAGRDDPAMFDLVAHRRVPMILMHMQGQPATMQADPAYQDVVREIRAFLSARIEAAVSAGIAESAILVDPGFGFGKTVAHNLELLRRLGEFAELGRPIVVGTSRKGFLAKITSDSTVERLFGTAASISWAIANGAGVLRVHDVAPMSQVAHAIRAIQTGEAALFANVPVAGGKQS